MREALRGYGCGVTTRLLACLAVGTLALLTGCSSGQEDEVSATARQFYAAVAQQDGRAACALLAPSTRSEVEQSAQKACRTAILEESLPHVTRPHAVQAYGTMSQVRYGGETAFLSRFGAHWKVVAAGCTPPPSQSRAYDCQISGG